MILEQIAKVRCGSGGCPTVFRTDDGQVVVQGYDFALNTPAGESAVRIPASLLREAAAQIQSEAGSSDSA